MTDDDWRVVFESRDRRQCSVRALVLESAGIAHQVIADATGFAIVVPAEVSSEAARELRLYEEENPPRRETPRPKMPHFDPLPGIIAYVAVVCIVAWLDGVAALGENWRAAGRIDGELIRSGEWWRLFTALTLHADLAHLAGNLVFGTLFGLFAGRLLGSGVGWLAIVVCAAAGNLLNTLLLESSHKSIGASTAVFAALGIVAGFVWRAKLMSQERWPYRVGPIVGGLALLMYTGTGDANTDVGAHLMGFVAGFAGGMLLVRARDRLASERLQRLAGGVAAIVIATAWIAALSNSSPAFM